MSEKDKKTGTSVEAPGASTRDRREERRKKAEKEARRSRNTYIIVGIACLALAIFAVAWGSGIIQRSMTATTINGHKYTAAEVQYYYNQIKNMYSQYGLSSSSNPKETVIDEETGKTMFDSMIESAEDQMVQTQALVEAAEKDGFTLPQEYQDILQENLDSMEETWKTAGFASRAAMIRGYYGTYMTYDKLKELMEDSLLASAYAENKRDSFTYTDEDLETYYSENKDTMDTFTLTTFSLVASVETTDEEGNDIEMTDEEKSAALEEAKTAKKAAADAIKAGLEEGKDPEELATEYADDLTGHTVSVKSLGSGLNSQYSDWVKDSARANGDVTISEPEQSEDDTSVPTSYTYYVVRWEGRERNEEHGNSVRHILIAAEQDEDADAPTDEQYEAAKEKAEALLEEWKNGEATEESFAELAKENSADTGSAADGGLIEDITEDSGYVETFRDWATDPSRQEGDTGIVQNTGSSVKGYHIMYYIPSKPHWQFTAENALRNNDYNSWSEETMAGYSATNGTGLKFITV